MAVAMACALVAGMTLGIARAAAETGDSAPVRPASDGGLSIPEIAGPEQPEEYPLQLEPVGPERTIRQVSEEEVVVEYPAYGVISYSITAPPEHDAVGATVPTTLALTEDEEGPVITIFVHFRAGNPAAGGAPFVFPIMGGKGWEGGYRTISVELNEPKPPAAEPSPAPSPPAQTCTVPALHGLSLRAATARLRGGDCAIGQVHLARGATRGKAKVVKQFRPAGTQLATGASVAVKLG